MIHDTRHLSRILRQTAESESFRYLVERRHLLDAAEEIERLRVCIGAGDTAISQLQQEIADLKQQLKEEREIAERAVTEAMQDGANDAYAEGRRDERERHDNDRWGW